MQDSESYTSSADGAPAEVDCLATMFNVPPTPGEEAIRLPAAELNRLVTEAAETPEEAHAVMAAFRRRSQINTRVAQLSRTIARVEAKARRTGRRPDIRAIMAEVAELRTELERVQAYLESWYVQRKETP